MDLRRLTRDYLKSAYQMQVATCGNGQPWICSVYFVFDKDLNLYWISKPDRRHSKEIRENEKVAGAIVLQHTPGEKVRGLQFEGVAQELKGFDAEIGVKLYAERYKLDEERVKALLDGSDGHLCYRIQPKLFVLFDEVNFPDDPRQEFKL